MASGISVQQLKLRAFDLSERTTRLSRRSLSARWARLRSRSFLIAQTAVTAGLAWASCSGTRTRSSPRSPRSSAWVGPSATACVAGWRSPWAWPLMTTQAGVQSLVVTLLLPDPNQGLERWLDAVVGCAVALLVATIAPSSPLRRPARLAAAILAELAATLEETAAALRLDDEDAADRVLDRARATEDQLQTLAEANREGLAVIRHSPFRRGQRREVQAYAQLFDPLDRASRNLRVLARARRGAGLA